MGDYISHWQQSRYQVSSSGVSSVCVWHSSATSSTNINRVESHIIKYDDEFVEDINGVKTGM